MIAGLYVRRARFAAALVSELELPSCLMLVFRRGVYAFVGRVLIVSTLLVE